MSYILDALRKSEQERGHADAGSIGELSTPTAVSPRNTVVWIAASVVALALVVTGGYLLWEPRAPDAVATATPPAPAASSVTNDSSPPLNETARQSDVPPTLKPALVVPTPAEASTRDLAQEARVDGPKPKSVPLPAAKSRPENRVAAASRAPAIPNPPAPAVEQVKFLHLMPPDFQRSLPALAVNIHIYSPVESERILYINNRQYQTGDKIRDDIIVEEVVEDGAVLSHNGERFKLSRPR